MLSKQSRFEKSEPNFLPGFGYDTGGRLKIDPARALALPDVYDLSDLKPIRTDHGGVMYQYGDFVHFTGAAWDRPEVLKAKKEWMERVIMNGVKP